MTVVNVSEAAIAGGAPQIERELVQLAVLSSFSNGNDLSLSHEHPEDILQLARWRGLRIALQPSSESIDHLWGKGRRVTAIIACHNYGHFLDEAVRSLLGQSYLPDEIILSDDASDDDSPEVMRAYAQKYPDLIRLNLNETNQGIQSHFNKVVGMATGDFIVIIGADNRVPANYIESQFSVLAADETVGLAYTDFALFGGRAKNDYDRMRPDFRGERLANGVYLSDFPEYSEQSAALLSDGHNFIHGSTMYRKTAWKRVGGYIDRESGPEDMTLFQNILSMGLSAKKVSSTVLEYRQHSAEQANYQFSYFGEMQRLREDRIAHVQLQESHTLLLAQMAELRADYQRLEQSNRELSETLRSVRASSSFRVGNRIVTPVSRLVGALRRRNR